MENKYLEEAINHETTNVVVLKEGQEEDILKLYDLINKFMPFIKKSGNKKMLKAAEELTQEIYRDFT